jgi:hypothetical protein
MAVVQISRIQHRKGLQQDLPQLASAELGWAVDARRLYIGNGTIAEGAPIQGVTEILTQYSDILNISENYTFKGAQSGYTSQTGPTALTPILRTLQQKLDDFVSVRDFGARGDGNTDDTLAVQRAIDEVYFGNFALTTPRLRRKIWFPAGTYLINASLKMPSYTQMVGAGKDRTTIRQASNLFPLLQLKDSAGRSGADYGTGAGALSATNIGVTDMTLEHLGAGQNILDLDTVDQVEFTRVIFTGAISNSTSTVITNQNAVYARARAGGDVINVSLTECEFKNCDQGVIGNAKNLRIVASNFQRMSRGIVVDRTAAAANNIKVIGCTFDQIGRQAVLLTAATATNDVSFMSTMNYYGEVGTNYLGSGSTIVPVLEFAGSNNYSVGDNFERTDADHGVHPRVKFTSGGNQVGLDAKTGLTLGLAEHAPAEEIVLAGNVTMANTGIVFGNTIGATKLHYWLRRPNVSAYRQGTIDIIYDGTTIKYADEFISFPSAGDFSYPGPTGVTFVVSRVSSTTANLSYTADTNGNIEITYYTSTLRQ